MRHLAGSSASCRRAVGLKLSRYDVLGSHRFGFRPDLLAIRKLTPTRYARRTWCHCFGSSRSLASHMAELAVVEANVA